MNYTIERKEAFHILGVSRAFHAPEAMQEIPKFWDEYFRKGFGAVACGQFACCYDETPECNFRYAIGNLCELDAEGVYHIYNRPDRTAIPDGFELLTVPAMTWMRVECLGALPNSIQGMYPVIQKEFPADWERVPGWELEEYGCCETPEDAQKPDYRCFIWIPVRRKKESAICEAFNAVSQQYDANRRKFIPCFDGFYEESSHEAAAFAGAPKRILDLGAGTGILSAYWLKYCPAAEFVLTDVAEAMLELARRRFANCANVRFEVSDYSEGLPEGSFDAVISALSIHHLEDDAKAALFRRIYQKLPAGGWFFNFDQFCLENAASNAAQDALWVTHIESSGLPTSELARWRDRRKLDRECSVSAECAMLRESGFASVECFFRSGKFAVIAAQKR